MKTDKLLVFLMTSYTFSVGWMFLDVVKPWIYPKHHLILHTPKQFTSTYTSLEGEIEPLYIQCPIPLEDRVLNPSGIQCVWSSIETLGRWAEEPKLTNPPLTSRIDCKGYSSPLLAEQKLNQIGVRFEQSYGNRELGLELIHKAMKEGRGCLFGVPSHTMVLVHFDEQSNEVKLIDNRDQTLKVQTITVDEFLQIWDSWVLVIYADQDIISQKILNFK